MSTPARIAHSTDGRIRIEVPSRRGDRAYFESLAEQLVHTGQVSRARGNAAAASLVAEYDGPLEAMLGQFERCALQLARPDRAAGAAGNPAATLPARAMQAMPAALAALTGGMPVSPMLLAGAAFGAIGLVQTARGDIMLPALSAFWYAASALRLARLPTSGLSADQAALQSNSTLP